MSSWHGSTGGPFKSAKSLKELIKMGGHDWAVTHKGKSKKRKSKKRAPMVVRGRVV